MIEILTLEACHKLFDVISIKFLVLLILRLD